MTRYERANIQRLTGYVPGAQPASSTAVKLNTNENPYPPCDAVLRALSSIEADALRKYPPPGADDFRRVAAELHGVELSNIVATNGGDELLRLVITTFVEPGQPIGVLEPSYSLYPVLADIHGSPTLRVDLADDWSIPDDAAERMNGEDVALAFIVNPHAPSGRLANAGAITRFARSFRGVLLVDEAYVDFADPSLGHDLVPLVLAHENVLLLRTLSKGYSLAGLRFGYGIGPRDLIEPVLMKTRDSYNVDVIAQRLATAALTHQSEAAKTWALVRLERERLRTTLSKLGLEAPESQSNFLLCRVPGGAPESKRLQAELESQGIFVRRFEAPRLDDKLRITIGTPEQNDALLSCIERFVGRGPLPG